MFEYKFPPIEYLKNREDTDGGLNLREVQEQGKKLTEFFSAMGFSAKVVDSFNNLLVTKHTVAFPIHQHINVKSIHRDIELCVGNPVDLDFDSKPGMKSETYSDEHAVRQHITINKKG